MAKKREGCELAQQPEGRDFAAERAVARGGTMGGFLSPYVALDLTDRNGFFCGKVLADLGATVIKVERPGGDPSRMLGPFYRDEPDPEKSLYWFAYNKGKKGITLDLETSLGREVFLRLVKKADWVLESFAPGEMERLGLGYEALSRANPSIIMATITPFGSSGPYSCFKGSDLVLMAMGGYLFLCGDPDRPPVRVSMEHAWQHGAAEAAAASMMALWNRTTSGLGQHIDVSIHASLVGATGNAPAWWEAQRTLIGRMGQSRGGLTGGIPQRQTWPCKDGQIAFVIMGGSSGVRTNRALVEWMDSEGMADTQLKDIHWENFDISTAGKQLEDIQQKIAPFFLQHTLSELFEGARQRGMILYPVLDISDLSQNIQLKSRGYWVEVDHPELGGSLTYPGDFLAGPEKGCRQVRRAPIAGEDNEEVYLHFLGLSRDEFEDLRKREIV